MKNKELKFQRLMEQEGYDDELAFLEHCTFDSVIPGICLNCDYTIEVEPDCRNGWCEECNAGTVQSALVLKDMI